MYVCIYMSLYICVCVCVCIARFGMNTFAPERLIFQPPPHSLRFKPTLHGKGARGHMGAGWWLAPTTLLCGV